MFYAEKIVGVEIVERGIFLSIEEFVPYRVLGWSGTKETNAKADRLIRERVNAEIVRQPTSL